MTLNIHKQYGNARTWGEPVHFLDIRLGRNCLVRGLTINNGSWRLIMGCLDVSWSRVL